MLDPATGGCSLGEAPGTGEEGSGASTGRGSETVDSSCGLRSKGMRPLGFAQV